MRHISLFILFTKLLRTDHEIKVPEIVKLTLLCALLQARTLENLYNVNYSETPIIYFIRSIVTLRKDGESVRDFRVKVVLGEWRDASSVVTTD